MSPSLPERPDLAQLRRRARELLRAARAKHPDALTRIRAVSDRTSLTSAQLAIAREHGFASWAQMKAEVERRSRDADTGPVDPVGSASAPPWPHVSMETAVPGPVRGTPHLQEGLVLARPPEIIARGTVDGIAFELRAFVTEPAPGAEWWEVDHPVGPEAEFFLGEGGSLGGGSVPSIPSGHLAITGHSYGSAPQFVLWAGCVSEDVATIEVRLAEDRVRSIEPVGAPAGFPRFVLAFLPRMVPARMVALDAHGAVLREQDLPELPFRPDANSALLFASDPAEPVIDGPPRGWPAEKRRFRPGKGPRSKEDFLLHVAAFPLYVIPPELWDGIVGLSGSGGRGEGRSHVVTSVRFYYLDRAGDMERGIELVCNDPARNRHGASWSPRSEEVGWSFDLFGEGPQILCRFGADRRVDHSGGPMGRRFRGSTTIVVAGAEARFDRWVYFDYPELFQIRADLPDVAIQVEGWNITWEELESFAAMMQPLHLGSQLLERMKRAQEVADARWRTWFQERGG